MNSAIITLQKQRSGEFVLHAPEHFATLQSIVGRRGSLDRPRACSHSTEYVSSFTLRKRVARQVRRRVPAAHCTVCVRRVTAETPRATRDRPTMRPASALAPPGGAAAHSIARCAPCVCSVCCSAAQQRLDRGARGPRRSGLCVPVAAKQRVDGAVCARTRIASV